MLRLPPFTYHRPASLDDAVGLLAEHGVEALPIAGGTDLVPNMKHKLFTPAHLVALGGIPELRGVEVVDGDHLRIGASETLAGLAAHPDVRGWLPALADAAGQVAGPQLRNRGTIGGNLCLDTRCTYYNQTQFWRTALGFCLKKDGDVCHVTKVGKKCVAAQSADTPPVLATLGASVLLRSTSGERVVPVADFFVADGIANTVREPGEIVVEVRVPLPGRATRMAYGKLRQRNAIDFPLLSVATAGEFADDGTVEDLRIVVSALGSRQRVLSGVDKIAVGHRLDDGVIEAIAERAHAQCHPLTNIIVDPDWRRAMVPVHVRRTLRALEPAPRAA
ncbi:MAG TPA: FAD binding domain-containing protein [Longimicrobiales bacterium]|nr:FAD binding domain-containing protein [Longimicrobiales bacterium]